MNYTLMQRDGDVLMALGGLIAGNDEEAKLQTANLVRERLSDGSMEPSYLIALSRPDGGVVVEITAAEFATL
jgi:hypothetical protein